MNVVPLVAVAFIRSLHATLRVRHVRAENAAQPQSIVAFWHDHVLMMLHSRYPRPISVLSSASKDGELAIAIYARYGVGAVRGSSTRGGSAALRAMIEAGRSGLSLAITPDGPRGPRRELKMGVIAAAKATGLPIVPVAFAAKKKSCCGPGTAWSFRCRSPRRSSFTATRSSCRVTAMRKSGA